MNDVSQNCRRCNSTNLTEHRDDEALLDYTKGFTVCNDCNLIMLNSTLYVSFRPDNAAELFKSMVKIAKQC